MEKFEFNPVKGYEDGSAYPNPSNEAEVREQLMRPLYQLQEYINNFIEYLNSSEGLKDIGTATGSLADLLDYYVLKNDLANDLKGKLDANLGADNKGLILYIDEAGNIAPVSISKVGTALTEDVVMKYQGVEHVGKVMAVDAGGQVVPIMGAGGGSGPGGLYDISVEGKKLKINYVLTNELKVTDDGQGNVEFG